MSLIMDTLKDGDVLVEGSKLPPAVYKIYWLEKGPHCTGSVPIRQARNNRGICVTAYVCKHPIVNGKELPDLLPLRS